MSALSDKLNNGIVVNKEMVSVRKDYDGNVVEVSKIDYLSEKEINAILMKEKNKKEKLELELKDKEEKLAKEKEEIAKKEEKQRTLSAFDRWFRDIQNGIIAFTNEEYTNVIKWYREYLADNTIEVVEEIQKYL